MMERAGKVIAKHPLMAIAVVLAITVASVASVATFGLKQEFSEETFMPDMEMVRANDEIMTNFTSSYDVSILVKAKHGDVLTKDALVEMLEIERDIANSSLQDMLFTPDTPQYSMGSVADMVAQIVIKKQGVISYDEKIEALQGMNDSEIKKAILDSIFYPFSPFHRLEPMFTMSLSKDFNSTTMAAEATIINVNFDGALRRNDSRALQVEKSLDNIVSGGSKESISAYVMGQQLISDEIMKANNESMKILLPLAFAMVIVVLAIIYRDVIDVLISLLALAFAIMWMYGFGAAMGYSFNPMTTAIPVLLVGLGIDYGIHLTMRYREERRSKEAKEAVITTVKHVGMALLLATITTVVAFLSNITSPITLLGEFGILSAVGITASFIIMILFVPSCRVLRDRRGRKEEKARKGDGIIGRAMAGVAVYLHKHAAVVIAITILVSIFMGYQASHLSTRFEIEDFLPEDLEITQNVRYMMNEFVGGGTTEHVYVLVKGDMTSPQILRAMAEAITNMDDDENILKAEERAKASSILSLMKDYATFDGFTDMKYNETFSSMYNRYFERGVPKENTTAENISMLYEWLCTHAPLDTKMLLHRGNGYDESVIRIEVSGDADASSLYDELKNDIQPLDGYHAVITGGPILTNTIMNILEESQIRSLVITLIASLIILVIIFYIKDKSAVLGTLTLLPVALCVVWILGTMYLFGIPLNVMTISIASLTIGLGVTYGIHITHRFAEEIEKNDVEMAVKNTVQHTGSALFGAAATTIAGFGLLVFALMPPLQQFGGITALTIFYSFIASAFILPSILAIWARIIKRREIS
ncbi:MAG: RND family transporter [Thermoplasmata archaeon]|nr:RND family transporter [Thermoplasmata archaeon]